MYALRIRGPARRARGAGRAALVAGIALAAAGIALVLLGRPGPAPVPDVPSAPPPAVEHLAAVTRLAGRPYRVSQRVAISGPVTAKQYALLSADACVRIECVCRYESVVRRPAPGELVEEREIQDAGVAVLALELTDHSLRTLVARLKDAGYLVPGDVATRFVAGQAGRVASELLGRASDHLMAQWMAGRGRDELTRAARELGVAPDQALAAADRLPGTIASMRGRRFVLRHRAGLPTEVTAADGAPITPEVRRWLEHSAVFLEADLARAKEKTKLEVPARRLEDVLLAAFVPGATGGALTLEGVVSATLQPALVARPGGESLREISLVGRLDMRLPGVERESSGALDLDADRSCALVGAESGVLRELELFGRGRFAGWAIERWLGLPTTQRLEGDFEITASQRCEPR